MYWAGLGEREGHSALDFAEISLAADSGALRYRENLQGVSVECSVTSFSHLRCDKNRYNVGVCRKCVGLYAALQQSHIFS